ncbi:hypothetical protein D3C86_2171110 [compost metagenome]
MPTKAPSRPAEAGAERLSTLVKIVQAKPFEIVPLSTKVSISWRAGADSCCWLSPSERSILPLIQLAALAEASTSTSTV